MQLDHDIFIEKYRPKRIEDILLPFHVKKSFIKFIKEGNIPNLLFYSSSPGVGKTTAAKALVHQLDADYIYINTSIENGIDTLRENISRFASTMSLVGGKKIVILDEFDGASQALQKALRASIEEFFETCRFILTCNYITQIIEPLKSRCEMIDFNFMSPKVQDEMKAQINKRLTSILTHEKIEFNPEIIEKIVNTYYPDIRHTLKLLQQYSRTNGVIDEGIFSYDAVDQELYQLIIEKKFNKARKFVIEKNYNFDELYTDLFRNFIPKIQPQKQPQAILAIAEYAYRNSLVVDKEICFSACLIEIMKIL